MVRRHRTGYTSSFFSDLQSWTVGQEQLSRMIRDLPIGAGDVQIFQRNDVFGEQSDGLIGDRSASEADV